MEFSIQSIYISIFAAFCAFLWLRFRSVTRSIRVQQRRYPMFAVRDRLARMRLDDTISEELFRLCIRLCNSAMVVSDEMNLIHLSQAMAKVAKDTSRSKLRRLAFEQIRKDPEFAKLYAEILAHIIRWCFMNSVVKHPLRLASLIIRGTTYGLFKDFKKVKKTQAMVLQAA